MSPHNNHSPRLTATVLIVVIALAGCRGSSVPRSSESYLSGTTNTSSGGTTALGSIQHRLNLVKSSRPSRVQCPAPTHVVSTTKELHAAVASAKAGDTIRLTAGVYQGPISPTVSGTADLPIWLCGPNSAATPAIVRNDHQPRKYLVHLASVNYWRLSNLHISHGLKGIVLDDAHHNHISSCSISEVSHEGVHFRKHSTHNTLQDSSISRTGLEVSQFGEGVYVGSAVANWCRYTSCQPDRSNHNKVLRNNMSQLGSEGVDIKEGVEYTDVFKNQLQMHHKTGSSRDHPVSPANSGMDIKGNNNTIVGNHIANPPQHAFQSRPKKDAPGGPYGHNNLFHNNRVTGTPALPGGRAFDARRSRQPIVTCTNVVGPLPLGVQRCVDTPAS